MWYLAAKAKILASQHFDSLHKIKFPLHSIFFQNNSFFMGIWRTYTSSVVSMHRRDSMMLWLVSIGVAQERTVGQKYSDIIHYVTNICIYIPFIKLWQRNNVPTLCIYRKVTETVQCDLWVLQLQTHGRTVGPKYWDIIQMKNTTKIYTQYNLAVKKLELVLVRIYSISLRQI